MNRQILSLLASVALISCVSNPVQAGLINGSFEDPHINVLTDANFANYQAGATNLTGWTVEAGSVNVLWQFGTSKLPDGTPLPALPAADGSQYLDLNGLAKGPGEISQVMNATAGQTYQLSFAYTGYLDGDGVSGSSVGNSINYQIYDDTSGTVLAHGSVLIRASNLYTWSTVDLQATATTGRLGVRLASDGAGTNGYVGPVIDNVVLAGVSPSVSVPEPSSICLTAIAGIIALGYRPRKR